MPGDIRGAAAGVGGEPVIAYTKDLGVTAVELLPVHAYINDKALVDRGLTNYWGYNSIVFFAPDAKYSSSGATGGQVDGRGLFLRGSRGLAHSAGRELLVAGFCRETLDGIADAELRDHLADRLLAHLPQSSVA